jgi:hypothetical protein
VFLCGAQSQSSLKPKRERKPNPTEKGVSAQLKKRLWRLRRSEVVAGSVPSKILALYKTDMKLLHHGELGQSKVELTRQILAAFDRTGGRGRPAKLAGFSSTEYTPVSWRSTVCPLFLCQSILLSTHSVLFSSCANPCGDPGVSDSRQTRFERLVAKKHLPPRSPDLNSVNSHA